MVNILRACLFYIAMCAFTSETIAQPIVIAHRGASGYLPEHTLEAATLAYAQGADFIEQDVVLSKDGIPIVLHDIHLDTVTDVAMRFPDRKRPDGRYYVLDFSLNELKTLRVNERRDLQGKPVFSGRYKGSADFQIATLTEHLELLEQLNRQLKKRVGAYPEIKSPMWHRQQGYDISQAVVDTLRRFNLDNANAPVYVQCFDFNEVKRLRLELGLKAKLVQLIGENSWRESTTDYEHLKTPAGLADIAKYAQGIGPWLPQLYNAEKKDVTPLIDHAKKVGLLIHPYTHRIDALPVATGNEELLHMLFTRLRVDGVFTDFPDNVVDYLRTTTRP